MKKRITANVLKQDPNTWNLQQSAVFIRTIHNMHIFGIFPLSSHKTALKQQLNGAGKDIYN